MVDNPNTVKGNGREIEMLYLSSLAILNAREGMTLGDLVDWLQANGYISTVSRVDVAKIATKAYTDFIGEKEQDNG